MDTLKDSTHIHYLYRISPLNKNPVDNVGKDWTAPWAWQISILKKTTARKMFLTGQTKICIRTKLI